MITGIEILKFGVEDRQIAQNFLTDFGLRPMTSDLEGTDLFQTQNGCKVYLFDIDDTRLPTAIEAGSTLREVTWGVDRDADFDDLTLKLSTEPGF